MVHNLSAMSLTHFSHVLMQNYKQKTKRAILWAKNGKFEPNKTTDDSYTPPAVYDAVLKYALENYPVPEGHVSCAPSDLLFSPNFCVKTLKEFKIVKKGHFYTFQI